MIKMPTGYRLAKKGEVAILKIQERGRGVTDVSFCAPKKLSNKQKRNHGCIYVVPDYPKHIFEAIQEMNPDA